MGPVSDMNPYSSGHMKYLVKPKCITHTICKLTYILVVGMEDSMHVAVPCMSKCMSTSKIYGFACYGVYYQ